MGIKKALIAMSLMGAFSFLLGCNDPEVGSKERPFTMYFVPSVDSQTIAKTAGDLIKFVEKEVSQELYGKDEGFYIKSAIPTSYIAVVEAFGTGRAEFATFNTFSYILTKDVKKYPIEAILTVIHGNGESTYKGQIIARSDSKINSIEDLAGKKFAFTDPASTSGFILPSQLLKEKGINLGEVVFAQKHDNVVTMVYQGQVDAGATYYSSPFTEEVNGKKVSKIQDARARVMTQFPDVEKKVKIVGFTEDIPNEPWVIRTNIYKDNEKNLKLKNAMTKALLAYAQTEHGKKELAEIYSVHGLVPANDDKYNGIRKTIAEQPVNLEEILNKKNLKKKSQAKK
ncbi:MAG: phosphate/phosphite/phosphonate ABC transporter substrate-binding protein [Bdellovibrionales bacterium]|nr:phosphate/phosphite/phosphonate ABC transporter substrate-binding protein [Bdellovibrionales bacterium]